MNRDATGVRMDLDTINHLIENHMRIERALNSGKELIERCLEEYYEFSEESYREITTFQTRIVEESGIKIIHQNDVLVLHIESVMPKRKDFQKNHTSLIIEDALEIYKRNHIGVMKMYPLQDALMVFEYCYPSDAKIIVDHDNYTLKNIVDSFVPDFVVSDNGLALKMLYLSRYTNNQIPFTNIHLLPFSEGINWISRWSISANIS